MDEPKIEFPCDYPIKVIMQNDELALAQVLAIVGRFDQKMNDGKCQRQPSRKDNYVSLRIDFWATGETQLQDLFVELKKIDAVRMVL